MPAWSDELETLSGYWDTHPIRALDMLHRGLFLSALALRQIMVQEPKGCGRKLALDGVIAGGRFESICKARHLERADRLDTHPGQRFQETLRTLRKGCEPEG